jgi:hypothetical protein
LLALLICGVIALARSLIALIGCGITLIGFPLSAGVAFVRLACGHRSPSKRWFTSSDPAEQNAGGLRHQVGTGKANMSEPLMKW